MIAPMYGCAEVVARASSMAARRRTADPPCHPLVMVTICATTQLVSPGRQCFKSPFLAQHRSLGLSDSGRLGALVHANRQGVVLVAIMLKHGPAGLRHV